MKVTVDFLKKAISPGRNFYAFIEWLDVMLDAPDTSPGLQYVVAGHAGKDLQKELIRDERNAIKPFVAASEYESGISGEGLSVLPSACSDEELISYFHEEGLNYSRGYVNGHPGLLSLFRMKRYLAAEEAVRRLEASS